MNPISKWFRSYVRQANIAIKDVYSYKGLDSPELGRKIQNYLQEKAKKPNNKFSYSTIKPTYSSKKAFIIAKKYMHQTIDKSKKPILDVRHMM